MPMRVLLPILLVPVMLHGARGQDPDEAQAVSPAEQLLERAIEAQGGWTRDRIVDVYLLFMGQIAEEGRTNSVQREYWYRAGDRAFRLRTSPLAAVSEETEHGVLGRRYWDRAQDRLQELSRGNRDHEEMIRAIRDDRDEFERIVSMLLLSRLRDGRTQLTLRAEGPVLLAGERPPEVRAVLRDADERRYHVLDVVRPDEPRLRAFLDTEDLTVRKVEQYRPDAPAAGPEFVYYFGAYKRDEKTGLVLPRYFSVHTDIPKDDKSRDETLRAKGNLTVVLNSGLSDAQLAP